MVSRCHGRAAAASAKPPHRSTTVSPSTVTHRAAPTSTPLVRFLPNAARSGSYSSRAKPCTSPSSTRRNVGGPAPRYERISGVVGEAEYDLPPEVESDGYQGDQHRSQGRRGLDRPGGFPGRDR